MVATKDRLVPRKDSSSKASSRKGGYLKRFKEQRPSNTSGDCHGDETGRGFPSPSNGVLEHPSVHNGRQNASYRSQRPQMTPRRVLRNGPMTPESPSHPSRSTRDDRKRRDESLVKNPRLARSPRTARVAGKTTTTTTTPRVVGKPRTPRAEQKTRDPRMEKKQPVQKPSKSSSSKKHRTKDKAVPLLSAERRDESDTRNERKTSRNASYHPPALDTGRGKRREIHVPTQLSSPHALAEAKKKARAKMGRLEPPDMTYSIDSDRKDKYVMSDESNDPVMQNRFLNSGASPQSKGAYTEGFSANSRDTYDDTVGDDTMDEEMMPDETFSMDEKSMSSRPKRRFLRHGFSGSVSENTSFGDGSVIIKQQVAWGCIGLSAIQFAILTTQVLLCGVASFAINPTLGPYPDAFSEWGGKNTYLLVEGQQYFRYITPVFLHVGYLHLFVNVFFQLETCAYLEREWGFCAWFTIYLVSGFGSCLAASAIDSNGIAVCSSGALMGLFGARISQAILWTAFETHTEYIGQGSIIFERLGGVMCSAAVVFALTCLTYIDWSGHLGGLFTGLFAGFFFFAHAIHDSKIRRAFRFFSSFSLLVGGSVLFVILFQYATYDEELADACDYFRNLYSEGYTCECEAFS